MRPRTFLLRVGAAVFPSSPRAGGNWDCRAQPGAPIKGRAAAAAGNRPSGGPAADEGLGVQEAAG